MTFEKVSEGKVRCKETGCVVGEGEEQLHVQSVTVRRNAQRGAGVELRPAESQRALQEAAAALVTLRAELAALKGAKK